MNKNLKFQDEQTELLYNYINNMEPVNFFDNTPVTFKGLYDIWDNQYRDICEYRIGERSIVVLFKNGQVIK